MGKGKRKSRYERCAVSTKEMCDTRELNHLRQSDSERLVFRISSTFSIKSSRFDILMLLKRHAITQNPTFMLRHYRGLMPCKPDRSNYMELSMLSQKIGVRKWFHTDEAWNGKEKSRTLNLNTLDAHFRSGTSSRATLPSVRSGPRKTIEI